jgi:hypothetical protein
MSRYPVGFSNFFKGLFGSKEGRGEILMKGREGEGRGGEIF